MRQLGWVAMLSGCAATAPTVAVPPGSPADQPAVLLDAHATPLQVTGNNVHYGDWSATRAIVSIEPAADAWFKVELAGSEDVAARQIAIHAPGGMPFKIHDVLEIATHRVQVGGIAFDEALAISDHDRLRVGVFTDHATIGDWAVQQASDKPCRIAVSHAGTSTIVAPSAWYRLTARDGAWAISAGDCRRPGPAPDQPLPDDWAPDPITLQVSRL